MGGNAMVEKIDCDTDCFRGTHSKGSMEDIGLDTLIYSFIGNFKRGVEDIKNDIVSADIDMLKNHSHKLSGSAIVFGYSSVGKVLEELNDCAGETSVDFEKMASIFNTVEEMLAKMESGQITSTLIS